MEKFSLFAVITYLLSGLLNFVSPPDEPTVPPDPPLPVEQEKPEDTLTIVSCNDNFLNISGGYVPEGAKLNYVVLEDDISMEKLDSALDSGINGEVPDIYILEPEYLAKYLNSGKALPLSQIWITDEDAADMFKFTLNDGRDPEGRLCALSVINSPGVFLYRRSAAKKLFGTDDPGEVQKHLSDWDSFLETAELAKENGLYMTVNYQDMFRAYCSSSGFVNANGEVEVPSAAMDWAESARKMYQKGWCRDYTAWSDEWLNSVSDSEIFGWFGANWFAESMFGLYTSENDWAVCEGPQGYCWGGFYAVVNPYTDSPKAAEDMLRRICLEGKINRDSVTEISGNREVYAELQYGSVQQLGGQNPQDVYLNVLDNLQSSRAPGKYDSEIGQIFVHEMSPYITGKKTQEKALNSFRKAVLDKFPELK